MAKWTPGPWKVVIDDDGNPLSGRPSVSASDELDCGIVHWDGFVQEYWRSARGDKEIHANAHLIAAAPELYDALKQFVSTFDTAALVETDHTQVGQIDAYRAAISALAKARGEFE